MKKRFSKKSLLSLLTVSAIVVTMAGSYAVWDKLSDSKTTSLTIDKATTVSLDSLNYTAVARTDFTDPAYTSDVATIKATDVPDGIATDLTLEATVKDAQGTNVTTEFKVEILDATNGDKVLATDKAATVTFADRTTAATGGQYKVKLTPKDSTTQAGTTVSVTLDAKLSKTTVTP